MQTSGARALREDDQEISRRTARFERSPGDPVPLRPPGFEGARSDPTPLRSRGFERPASAERRTITITGHPVPPRRRRSTASRPSPAKQQIAARPDRLALWAFLLGLFLVLVAAATANAAPV